MGGVRGGHGELNHSPIFKQILLIFKKITINPILKSALQRITSNSAHAPKHNFQNRAIILTIMVSSASIKLVSLVLNRF
jgi:hypothetical protein